MKAITIYCAILILAGGLVFVEEVSAVPGRISYQGKLSDPEGLLIDQECAVSFSLYTEVADGGPVWSESHDRVQVTRGLFNVILGSVVDVAAPFQTQDNLWLEITVNGETLSPRQKMASVGYAMSTDGFRVSPNGNIGIGTDSPDKKLSVAGRVKSEVGEKSYYMIPRGGIVMWSKPLSQIPSGWQLCDGENDTPNLCNRFVYGVGESEAPGTIGGAATHTHTFSDTVSQFSSSAGSHSHIYSQVPSHSHTIGSFSKASTSTGAHSHDFNPPSTSLASAGNHTHSVAVGSTNGGSGYAAGCNTTGYGTTSCATSSAGAHTHSVTVPQTTSSTYANHSHSCSFTAFNTGSTGAASSTTAAESNHTHSLDDYTAEGTTGSASSLPPYIKLAFIIRVE